jgi:outer membrane receptor protein involved in Fe transport
MALKNVLIASAWLALSTTAFARPQVGRVAQVDPVPAPPDAGVDAAPPDAAPAPAPTPPLETPSAPTPPTAALPSEDDAAIRGGETIEIDDTAPAESASSVHITRDDLKYRSVTQVSDILRQVPGLMVSQHAGGGKSDQYFIRGFDADHGTDIAIYADGVPVNMPSHGHGQGYADTHFLIPETIDAVDVHKGPYSARFGDFYTAGAMELKTIDKVDGPTLWIAGGVPLAGPKAFDQYNRRIVGMASPELRDNSTDKSLLAVEIGDTDGPFENPQHFRQGNALVKWQGNAGPGVLHIEGNWYEAKWNASGQVPESAVDDGTISQFGSLDPSEGGDTSRTTGQIAYTVRDQHGGSWTAMAYALSYNFRLYSNFTLFARDPVHGDEIEQTDARSTYGLDLKYERHFDAYGHDTWLTVGAQTRNDDVENSLWHDEKRVRLADCFDTGANPCNHTLDRIRNFSGYVEANVHFAPHIHVLPGVRFDQFVWDVDDLNPATSTDPSTQTGGTAGKAIASPKLSIEMEVNDQLDLFANSGYGFHSNDARGNVAAGGNGSIARALGAEAGVRTSYLPHSRFSADFWYLHLDSELVWNGDDGGTNASGPTERYGVDLEGAYNPFPWLRLDANVSLAHSQFVANAGNGNALALAPKLMGQGGVTYIHDIFSLSLRGRGIADRPGNDDNTLTAKGYFIFDLIAAVQPTKKLGINLTVNNLFNQTWREAQFADTSAVTPTSAPIEQMHFTPGIPLTATVTVSYQL